MRKKLFFLYIGSNLFIHLLFFFVLQVQVLGRNEPICFMIASDETTTDLSDMCGNDQRPSDEQVTPEMYLRRGFDLAQEDQYQLAISEYTKAINLSPDYAAAYEARAYMYRLLGDRQNAYSDYHRAAQFYEQQGNQLQAQLMRGAAEEL